MSRYRRLYIPGGTYFFTVALADRTATTLVDEIALLRSVYASVVREHPVKCEAMVVLPDHIHAVWTLPDGDADFSIRWKRIKGRFSQHCKATGTRSPSKAARGEKGIWQRRFWEHAICDADDFRAHVDYCWWNPVKHGLVQSPGDWPYSSFRRVGETHASPNQPTARSTPSARVGFTHPTFAEFTPRPNRGVGEKRPPRGGGSGAAKSKIWHLC